MTAAGEAHEQRRAVVLLTDGEDFGNASGAATRDDALKAAATLGVPFFVVGLGTEVDAGFLESLAQTTGGAYYPASRPDELAGLYRAISDRLRLQYSLHTALPQTTAAGRHTVSVSVQGGSANGAFTIEAAAAAGPRFEGVVEPLGEPTVVSVSGAPRGSRVRFTIDGQAGNDTARRRFAAGGPVVAGPGEAPHARGGPRFGCRAAFRRLPGEGARAPDPVAD